MRISRDIHHEVDVRRTEASKAHASRQFHHRRIAVGDVVAAGNDGTERVAAFRIRLDPPPEGVVRQIGTLILIESLGVRLPEVEHRVRKGRPAVAIPHLAAQDDVAAGFVILDHAAGIVHERRILAVERPDHVRRGTLGPVIGDIVGADRETEVIAEKHDVSVLPDAIEEGVDLQKIGLAKFELVDDRVEVARHHPHLALKLSVDPRRVLRQHVEDAADLRVRGKRPTTYRRLRPRHEFRGGFRRLPVHSFTPSFYPFRCALVSPAHQAAPDQVSVFVEDWRRSRSELPVAVVGNRVADHPDLAHLRMRDGLLNLEMPRLRARQSLRERVDRREGDIVPFEHIAPFVAGS